MTAEEIFGGLKPDPDKLKAFGFSFDGKEWGTHVRLQGLDLDLFVTVTEQGGVRTELIDPAFGEPYTQHLVAEAEGEFVGNVRAAYERALTQIAAACFEKNAFREPLTARVIAYAREKYGEEAEFLWERYPDTAVLRRKDSGKWYAVLMNVGRGKLGLSGSGQAELVDVRTDPVSLPRLVDGARVLPGWHMNKKHWVSVFLDGTVPFDEVAAFLEESRRLAK